MFMGASLYKSTPHPIYSIPERLNWWAIHPFGGGRTAGKRRLGGAAPDLAIAPSVTIRAGLIPPLGQFLQTSPQAPTVHSLHLAELPTCQAEQPNRYGSHRSSKEAKALSPSPLSELPKSAKNEAYSSKSPKLKASLENGLSVFMAAFFIP